MLIAKKVIRFLKKEGITKLPQKAFTYAHNKTHHLQYALKRGYLKTIYENVKTDKYIYINPASVKCYLMNSKQTRGNCQANSSKYLIHKRERGIFDPFTYSGIILGGEWDKYTFPYKFDRVANFVNAVINNKCLSETEYFHIIKLRSSKSKFRNRIKKRINKVIRLKKSMEKNGFLQQHETGEKNSEKLYAHPWPITVNIGRDGEIILNQTGHHRLAVAKEISLEKIPVLVVVRHKKWQKIRDEVSVASSKRELSDRAQKQIAHPDVNNFALVEKVDD